MVSHHGAVATEITTGNLTMARTWGATRGKFWELDLSFPDTPTIAYGGDTTLDAVVEGTANWTRYMSGIGNGSATFYAVDGWDTFIHPGHVCLVEQVTNHSDGTARILSCFLVEDIEPAVRNGINVIDVRGPGLESLLNKQLVWGQIGETVTTNTTLAVTAGGPDDREMAEGAPTGNETVVLDTSNSDDIGQEIRITLDGGAGTHVTVVTEREFFEDQWVLHLRDRLPANATAGNAVEIWTRRIRVHNPAPFIEGVVVMVDLANGQAHTTLATGETDTTNRVTLEDALPSQANSGAAVAVYNSFAATNSDVTKIIAAAPGWNVTFQTGTGTAVGSAHQPQGESVIEMISGLAERTGEYFRHKVFSNPNKPSRIIEWRRTPDSSGVTLVMYASDEEARQAADEMSLTKGAIFSLRRRQSLPMVTRVFPSAGDQRIDLSSCSSTMIAYAATKGCHIMEGVGLYEPQSVYHEAGTNNYGWHEIRQTYGDISLSDAKSRDALVSACDQLLLSAVQTLVTAQEREYYTIDAYIPVAIAPGQTVKIENATGTTPAIGTSSDWVVLEVNEKQVNGRPRTSLVVSNMTGLRWTPANITASRIRGVIQSQRRVASSASGTTVVATGTGGGGATDHGTLTGLTDVEDHPGYLLVSGGRALTGNMAVNAGITIDGVDLSAHAANADAHHPRVTAVDSSIVVNATQGVKVSDALAGAGLALTGGIMAVNTALAHGTTVNADIVAVAPSPTGGMWNTPSGTSLKLPFNSGMVVDANGTALGTPLSIGSTTTNAITGSGHSHDVDSVDNAKTAPGKVLQSSVGGDLTLRRLTADQVTAPLLDTATGNLRLDPAGGVTVVDSDMQFVGARAITTDTGSLTLSPAASLVLSPDDNVTQIGPTTTLKTAHWSSGFLGTGWGMTYDGHLDTRSIYADELHVAAFIADTARVAVGAEYITPSMALVARPFTIPAVNGTGTLYVEDAPGLAELPVFSDNDWVLLRIMDRSGGGLLVANAWGQVTAYTDRDDGQQSWTFTTRSALAAAIGETAQTGAVALDFGKAGDGWWWVTTLDGAGSPYAGITTWQGANPYDEGNRVHRLRLGQLRGVTGVYEWGLQSGTATSSRVRFTDLRSEIHGSRLSLYAGDGGKLQVSAADVVFYRTGTQSSTLTPDGDGTAVNVETTGANYYSTIDEAIGSPNHGDYIANAGNLSGAVFLSLTNPAAFTSIFRVDIRASLKSVNLSNDTIRIYGQVFASDETTPLTGEVLLATRTANTTATATVTAPHEGYGAGGAVQTDWNGARLRLRWEYEINANEEAIRLDPSVPSLAVGNPLPTAVDGGGDGLWVGYNSGAYKLRLGKASGVGLHWTGSAVELRNSNNVPTITLDASGNSRFDGAMTIGALGGIWQGTGSFATPTTGLKLYNSGGIGRLSTYNGGLEQITINTAGELATGDGRVVLDRNGLVMTVQNSPTYNPMLRFLNPSGVEYGNLGGLFTTGYAGLLFGTRNGSRSAQLEIVQDSASEEISLATTGEANRIVISSGGSVSVVATASIGLFAPTRISGGLVLGDAALTPPAAGRILMKQSTGATTVPAGAALLYVENQVNGKQAFYIRFDDGTFVKIAESNS